MPLTNYDCQGDIVPFESKCSIPLPKCLQPTITSAADASNPSAGHKLPLPVYAVQRALVQGRVVTC